MSEVNIKFEHEGLDGIVAVGTYVSDAMSRFGLFPPAPCDPLKGKHSCSVELKTGIDLLSSLTDVEREHFAGNRRKTNERLACEAKFEHPGEVVIMTNQTNTKNSNETQKDTLQEEFDALPLDKKFAKLFRMEAVTLGETLSYVLDSPYKVFEKIGDVMAGFGMKIEEEAKKARRPAETRKAESAAKTPTGRTRTATQKPRSAPKA